jgi:hypothetical protein
MQLQDDDLLKHITHQFAVKPNDFPRTGSLNYPAVIDGWIRHLKANTLPYVTAGGIAADRTGHLTMHDNEHVLRVRQVAANLISQAQDLSLTPYELTLLLIAIYLHDIGNILGRRGHEKAINRVIKSVAELIALDPVEMNTARQIATVHGGTVDGSKDTISTLPEKSAVYGQHVRLRLLAAILRLADELADDPARANKTQLATGVLPVESEVFHVVAGALHSQMADPATREITLSYNFPDVTLFQRKLGKLNGKVHLLDEVFERSMKTFHEARYCSRFMRPYLEFERVSIDTMIFDADQRLLHSIKYTIAEHGYGDHHKNIYDMVPELRTYQGNGKLTASHLKRLLRDAAAAHDGEP